MRTGGGTAERWAVPALALLLGLAAAAIRIRYVLHSGALAVGSYDDGVHYAAAAALVHGRLPYRDFLFLQPPGMALVSSPFAALAGVVGDARAFGGARLAAAVLGGLNTALVVLVLRRFGVAGAATGGALYAVAFSAVYVERSLVLEAPGTTGVLLALLLMDRARRAAASPRWWLLAGAAAGLTVGLKIWYVVPFAALLVFARPGRLRFLLGGAIAGAAVYVPFFVAAPGRMWQQVVAAQLGRPDDEVGVARRLRSILGVTSPGRGTPIPHVPGTTVALALAVVAVALIALALTDRRARALVALLAACTVLLLVTPSFFQHYTALTAAPLALVAGAGVQRLADRLRRRWARVGIVAVAVVLALVVNVRHDGARQGVRMPVAALRAATAEVRGCVVADDPTVLVVLNRLTPDLEDGCALQPDPSGAGYVLPGPGGRDVERLEKPAFQREIVRYLESGSAFLWTRGEGLQLSPASIARLESAPVLLERGRWVLRASPDR